MAIAIVNSDFKHNVRNGYTSLRYDNGCSDCKSNFPIRQVVAVDDGIDFGHAGAWDSVDSSLSLVKIKPFNLAETCALSYLHNYTIKSVFQDCIRSSEGTYKSSRTVVVYIPLLTSVALAGGRGELQNFCTNP